MIANNFTKNVRILCLSCQKLQRNCQILLKRAEASIIPIVLCHIHTILLPYFPHDSLNPALGVVYLIQHDVIKFISDLRQVNGFLRILRFPPPIKLTATI